MTLETARFIGDIPLHYDEGLGPIIFDDYAADMARRVAATSPGRVLETAAGTGVLTRHLRDCLPAKAHLVATDLNPPMLDRARARFRLAEAVEFQSADATNLPFVDGGFDAMACQFGVMFFPDKDLSYREAFRLLCPGGHYIFSLWDTPRHNAFGRITQEVVDRFFPNDPPKFMAVPFSYSFDAAKDSLTTAGFTQIGASVVRVLKVIPDARAFARGLIHGSPVADQVRARGDVEPDVIVEALAAEFHREFGADPGRMALQAIVFSAMRPL